MRITKFAHSCLLVNHNDLTLLIDPGNFSEMFQENVGNSEKIDYILITHDHSDHMSLPLIKAVLRKFPDCLLIGPTDAVAKLGIQGIKVTISSAPPVIVTDAPHEQMFGKEPVAQNIAFTIFDLITHPGDSFQITKTTSILALPVVAPWGSTVQAVKKAIELNPKIVIPIHDAMMKDEINTSFLYPTLTKVFNEKGIEFKSPINGEEIIIEV